MSKCPYCNNEIEFIKLETTQCAVERHLYLKNGKLDVRFYDWYESSVLGDNIFSCPQCDYEFITNNEQALNFLKGIKNE